MALFADRLNEPLLLSRSDPWVVLQPSPRAVIAIQCALGLVVCLSVWVLSMARHVRDPFLGWLTFDPMLWTIGWLGLALWTTLFSILHWSPLSCLLTPVSPPRGKSQLMQATMMLGWILLALLMLRVSLVIVAKVGIINVSDNILEENPGSCFRYVMASVGTLAQAVVLAAMPPVLIQAARWRTGQLNDAGDGPRVAAVGFTIIAFLAFVFDGLGRPSSQDCLGHRCFVTISRLQLVDGHHVNGDPSAARRLSLPSFLQQYTDTVLLGCTTIWAIAHLVVLHAATCKAYKDQALSDSFGLHEAARSVANSLLSLEGATDIVRVGKEAAKVTDRWRLQQWALLSSSMLSVIALLANMPSLSSATVLLPLSSRGAAEASCCVAALIVIIATCTLSQDEKGGGCAPIHDRFRRLEKPLKGILVGMKIIVQLPYAVKLPSLDFNSESDRTICGDQYSEPVMWFLSSIGAAYCVHDEGESTHQWDRLAAHGLYISSVVSFFVSAGLTMTNIFSTSVYKQVMAKGARAPVTAICGFMVQWLACNGGFAALLLGIQQSGFELVPLGKVEVSDTNNGFVQRFEFEFIVALALGFGMSLLSINEAARASQDAQALRTASESLEGVRMAACFSVLCAFPALYLPTGTSTHAIYPDIGIDLPIGSELIKLCTEPTGHQAIIIECDWKVCVAAWCGLVSGAIGVVITVVL